MYQKHPQKGVPTKSSICVYTFFVCKQMPVEKTGVNTSIVHTSPLMLKEFALKTALLISTTRGLCVSVSMNTEI